LEVKAILKRRNPLLWLRSLGALAAGLLVITDSGLCRRPTNWTNQAFQAGLGLHGAAVAEAVAGVATRPKTSKFACIALEHAAAATSLVLALWGYCSDSTGLLLGLLPEASSVPSSLVSFLGCRRRTVLEPALALALLARVVPVFLLMEATSVRVLAVLSCVAWLLRLPSFAEAKPEQAHAGAELELGLLRGERRAVETAQEPCRLMIHDVIYDVTDLQDHPGGPAPLRRLAGQDATDAFVAVGHSEAARRLLQSFEMRPSEGRLGLAARAAQSTSHPEEYDLTQEPAGVWDSLRRLLVLTASVFLLLGMQTALSDGHELEAPAPAPALLGMGVAAAMAQLFFWGALPASWQEPVPHRPLLIPGLCQVALAMTVHMASYPVLAIGGALGFLIHVGRTEGPASPSALGTVAWALLFQACLPSTPAQPRGAGDAGDCVQERVEGLLRPSLAVLLLALALRSLLRAHGPGRGRSGVAGVCATVMAGLRIAGAIATCLWILLKQLEVGAAASHLDAVAGALRSGASMLLLGLVQAAATDASEEFGAGFVSGWLSATVGSLAALLGLGQDRRLGLTLLAWFLHLHRSAADLATRIAEKSRPEEGSALPAEASVRLLFLIDNFRSLVAMAVWSFLGRPLERLVTWMLPGRLRVFAFEAPIDDLGGLLQAGVCLMLEGSSFAESPSPGHVVCNVGHLPTADDEDLRATVRSSLKIMEELSGVKAALRTKEVQVAAHPPADGFVANLLCVLPKPGRRGIVHPGWQSVREVNLSVWSTEEAAVSWYRQSDAHAAILSQHKEGKLRTFGNLLLTLNATKVAWQRRCKACATVVEGFAQGRCHRCGAATYDLPAF